MLEFIICLNMVLANLCVMNVLSRTIPNNVHNYVKCPGIDCGYVSVDGCNIKVCRKHLLFKYNLLYFVNGPHEL